MVMPEYFVMYAIICIEWKNSDQLNRNKLNKSV